MLKHYLTIAFRGLMRYKWQNVVCILGLTIGFTAFALGGYWRYWEHHFDDFHPNAPFTYGITTTGIAKAADGAARELDQLHRDDFNWILENVPEIENFTLTWFTSLSFMNDGKNESVVGLRVDSAFFSMFYAGFIDGDYKNVPYDGSHIVLTERVAMKYFGKTDCMGEIVPGGNRKVAGVIRDYPSNSGFRFEFLSLTESNYNPLGRSTIYVQLNRHAQVSDVRKKIESHQSVAKTRFPGEEKSWSFNLRTLPELHLKCRPELESRLRNIQLLAIAGLLALISALMSHLVLFIGQQLKRRRRIAMFRSMGASTSYLFVKSLIDLVIPLIFAVAAFLFLINLLFPIYQSFTRLQGMGIYENFFSKPELTAMTYTVIKWAAVVVILFLVAGSLFITAMIGKAEKQTSLLLRRCLIASQVFIGSFFLFVALSLYKQFHFTQHKDKGIRVENIIQINAGAFSGFDHLTMKEELMRSPYIEDVTFTTMPVLTETGGYYLNLFGNINVGEEQYSGIGIFMIEPNFFDFFGMKMKEGEGLSGETDMVVNEMQMQAFGDKKLLGEVVKMFGNERKLSGVVNNYYYSTMQFPLVGLTFIPFNKELQEPYRHAYIKTKPENREIALEYAQTVLESQKTTAVPEGSRFVALTDIMDKLNRPERTLSLIFGILSLACILIVSFGIYSLISLTIEQRRKEIAIRKINGAGLTDILRLFFKEYLLIVTIGNALALTLGYFLMQRWFESYIYRTTLGWWLFAVVLITTVIIVFLSVVGKINNAASIEPAEALKYE